MSEILERYESDAVRGLQGMFHVPAGELARTFGRKDSGLLYAESDAIHRWLKLWEETCD
ncbi:MAG: hypothetical protein GX986_12515 [Firmicutes bacterium]|nr:hypothetical protein [Bacillota bacterium]